MILSNAKWISAYNVKEPAVPEFFRDFKVEKPVKKAELMISALGVYEAFINGSRVGDFILAPGWTSYLWRLQYQTYDVTDMLSEDNRIKVYVGPGWANGRIGWLPSTHRWTDRSALIAKLVIEYEDGECGIIVTDRSWKACKSPILESEIYDGEGCDSRLNDEENAMSAGIYSYTYDTLIPQEGPEIHEQEQIKPVAVIKTPAGETVIDFGQNLAGYPAFTVDAEAGDEIEISFAEILDENGNFYTRNYRTAQPKLRYICSGGREYYKPHLTYQGYRYIRLDKWHGKMETVEDAQVFTSIALNSEMKRIGYFESGSPLLNRFYENIVWSQKSNYIDVPTDCPQRDERMGWIGDAQIFARAGAFNFDTYDFMSKWLGDMRAEQMEDGSVPEVVPFYRDAHGNELGWIGSTAWSDACVIIPWSLYLAYGDKKILEDNFDMMTRWIEFMRTHGDEEYLFCNNGIEQFGDWVALDAPEGTKVGATDLDFICSAYYAYSTGLYVKAGKALGRSMMDYEELYENIVRRFREKFIPDGDLTCKTPTAYILAAYFGLADDPQKMADKLAESIHSTNDHLITGFLGTAYVMHVLTRYGYSDLAYTLLMHTDYPSWLYQVTAGATTVWEHWDGIRPDKTRWDDEMNSFNHYSYGAVLDWIVEAVCGLNVDERRPGYKNIIFAPHADKRLGYAKSRLDTRNGLVICGWKYEGDDPVYELTVPTGCTAKIMLAGTEQRVDAGEYRFDKNGMKL